MFSYATQINPQPFGNVAVVTPGTPVQLAVNLPGLGVISSADDTSGNYSDPVPCNKININASTISQAGVGNTGKVYIGIKSMVRATLAGVLIVIPPGGSYSITNNVGMNTYQFQKLYVDADNAGDAVYGSFDQV